MASTQRPDPQSTGSKRPDMTKPEMLAEIERVSGPARRLQEIRDALPTARAAASFDLEPGADAAAAGARRARRAAAAPGALTDVQRLTLIDQAVLMLETLYANLPLKRALHAIDPLQRLRLLRRVRS